MLCPPRRAGLDAVGVQECVQKPYAAQQSVGRRRLFEARLPLQFAAQLDDAEQMLERCHAAAEKKIQDHHHCQL